MGNAGIQRVTYFVRPCYIVGADNGLDRHVTVVHDLTSVVGCLVASYVLHWNQSPLCIFYPLRFAKGN